MRETSSVADLRLSEIIMHSFLPAEGSQPVGCLHRWQCLCRDLLRTLASFLQQWVDKLTTYSPQLSSTLTKCSTCSKGCLQSGQAPFHLAGGRQSRSDEGRRPHKLHVQCCPGRWGTSSLLLPLTAQPGAASLCQPLLLWGFLSSLCPVLPRETCEVPDLFWCQEGKGKESSGKLWKR